MFSWFDTLVNVLKRYLPEPDEVVSRLLLVVIIVPLLAFLIRFVAIQVRLACRRIFSRRLARLRKAVRSNGIWLAPRGAPPPNYRDRLLLGTPILMVGHLKGGVGKTTVAANIAAHFANIGEKVLLIDLDFQGSLSSMVVSEDHRHQLDDHTCRASKLLSGPKEADWLRANAWVSSHHKNLFVIPAFYDLARTENRLMIEWLIKDVPDTMPYFLAQTLCQVEVQEAYDRIIIDAPPRLTTACIQALCASTHLLVPTILDQLSAEAVATFLREVEELRKDGLCPHLTYLGVVGTMVDLNGKSHIPSVKMLQDQIGEVEDIDLLPEKTWIPEMAAISRAAGMQLAYFNAIPLPEREKIQKCFGTLGDEIATRMNMRS